MPATSVEVAAALVLLGGLAVASAADLREREISERLWQVLGILGLGLGGLATAAQGFLPLVCWAVVGAFALQHLFPWDDALGQRAEPYLVVIEAASYLGVIVGLAIAAVHYGVGPAAVPLASIALLASVVLARGLFELGVLYGGADAKALIVAALLLPLWGVPVLYAPSITAPVLAVIPFAVTLLTNAAVLAIAVPLSLAIRNLRTGEFDLRRGFTGYRLPVSELPRRFVWVRDDRVGEDGLADDVETSGEDRERRRSLAERLERDGVRDVWVTPQIPFVVLMSLGALAALLVGNILLDLFTLAG